jgi:hypothetical protein
MSAYILQDDTIDLLVTAGLYGVGIDGGLRVYHEGEILTYNRYEHADQLGTILKTANYDSVNYRYKESTEMEGYRYNGNEITQYLGGVVIPWGQVLKSARCYEYQSCETPEWEKSLANAIVEAITRKVCGFIAEQDNAEWEWTRFHAEDIKAEIKSGLKS